MPRINLPRRVSAETPAVLKPIDLDDARRELVLRALSTGDTTVHDVSYRTKLGLALVEQTLLNLETAGLIQRMLRRVKPGAGVLRRKIVRWRLRDEPEPEPFRPRAVKSPTKVAGRKAKPPPPPPPPPKPYEIEGIPQSTWYHRREGEIIRAARAAAEQKRIELKRQFGLAPWEPLPEVVPKSRRDKVRL
jgi:hypothetical protein